MDILNTPHLNILTMTPILHLFMLEQFEEMSDLHFAGAYKNLRQLDLYW